MRTRRLWLVVGAVLAAIGALFVADPLGNDAALAQESDDVPAEPSDDISTEDDEATPVRSTSEVKVETLRSSSEFNGDLGFGETRDLAATIEGVLTWLPEEEAVINSGDVLWEINREPLRYFDGEIPMYRELQWGAEKGDDITQLESMLISQGYGPANWQADDNFDQTTRNALIELQKFYDMHQDGIIGPNDIMYGTDPLRVAQTAFVGDAAVGAPALTVTSATAKVSLSTSSRSLPTFQNTPDVVVVLADGTELAATLDETTATPADENGQFGYLVTYIVSDTVGEAQPVKVRIEQTLAENALTVPVDALVALAEGGYAVEVVAADDPDGAAALRAVEVIDFDDTRVAVAGSLSEGDLVVVP